MSVRVPKYRLHKGSDQALVEIDRRRVYLGRYNSAESREKYRRLVAELMSPSVVAAQVPTAAPLSVAKIILAYFRFVKTYYVKDGKLTNEVLCIRLALRRLRRLYGRTAAVEFGPKSFKVVRESLIQEGLSRKYVNDSMSRVRRMFRWAVAEELIPPSVFQALSAVPGLHRGRSAAKESRRVAPVAEETVQATLARLPEIVADMVRLQRLAGMRPAEVCIMRPRDIDRSGDVWVYRPPRHKTEHVGHDRVVAVGPRAQEILLRYLARDAEACCFRPSDSEKKRRAALHANRKTPLSYGNRPGTNRVRKPICQPSERYTTASYRRAIQRACDKAFPHPILSVVKESQLTEAQQAELQTWRAGRRWSPNQLRHSAATEIRRRFGLEAAQVVLGHTVPNVTQVYAERDLALAARVAREVG
jgi:integrase